MPKLTPKANSEGCLEEGTSVWEQRWELGRQANKDIVLSNAGKCALRGFASLQLCSSNQDGHLNFHNNKT